MYINIFPYKKKKLLFRIPEARGRVSLCASSTERKVLLVSREPSVWARQVGEKFKFRTWPRGRERGTRCSALTFLASIASPVWLSRCID